MKDRLKAAEVKAAKPAAKPYKLHDGGGLFLLVKPDGARYWRFRYFFAGRETLIGLGTYPDRTLEAARRDRDRIRETVAAGLDPSEQRKRERAARRAEAENTLEAVAREWYRKRASGWAASHAEKILGRLDADVFPRIGSEPIGRVNGPTRLAVLRKIEEHVAIESAHRVGQYLDAIFSYAIDTHRIEANPTQRPRALAKTVSKRHPTITDPKAVGALVRAIRGYAGSAVVRAALQLAPLLFVRPGELRAAQWEEMDLAGGEWRIPAERMKMRWPHLVPLSSQAVAILRDLRPLTDVPRAAGVPRYVFPGERGLLVNKFTQHTVAHMLDEAANRTCWQRVADRTTEATWIDVVADVGAVLLLAIATQQGLRALALA